MHRMDPAMASVPQDAVPASLFPGAGSRLWLGAMVPKRWARRAVTRHLVKRQIFAQGTAFADQLSAAAYLVRQRSGFARDQFKSAASDALRVAVRDELRQLFGKTVRARKGAP